MKKNILFLSIFILLSVKCFSQSPNYLWAKQQTAGGTGYDDTRSIVADANGNVIVTGYFFGSSITFGTTTLTNAFSISTCDIFIVKYDPNGNVLWAKQQDAGGNSYDYANSVAVDSSGNVIVSGSFLSSNITFGTTTLTNTSITSNDLFIVKYDPNGNVLWAKQQTAGGTEDDIPRSVATDADGNVIVTGSFESSSITFGSTTLTNASSTSWDIFIVKYDTYGNVLWAKQQDAGGIAYDLAYSVAADASGNVFVTGSFNSSSITFGTIVLINTGNYDVFIVKYDPSGNVLWAKQQDAGGSGEDFTSSVAADASGNVIISGSFDRGTLTFGNTTLTNAGTNNSFDLFIVKYDPNGNVLWAKQQDAGGTSGDVASCVAVDSTGNVIVTGYFNSSTITFGTNTLTNAGISGSDIFIVKYDPNGNVLWAKQQTSGGTSIDYANSVAADASGNVIVTGYFESYSITFGATTLTNADSRDIFIVKLGTTTGIENNTLNNEVNVYPNPTTGVLFLSSYYNVTLIDLTGKIITKVQNTNTIDISNNPAGIYFLLLTNNKGQIVQRSKVTKE